MMEKREFSPWEYACAHFIALLLFAALIAGPIMLLAYWSAGR